MAAGTPPIVTDVGGLPNYVSDGKTGIVAKMHFVPDSSEVLVTQTQASITEAFERALILFKDKDAYFKVAAAAMNQDNSWDARTDTYSRFFADLKLKPSQIFKLNPSKSYAGVLCNSAFSQLLPFIRKVEIHSKKVYK
jgi:glycogen synthase